MKIIDVAEFYAERGGGVRTYIHHKLAAAKEAGHELIVVAPGPKTGREARLGGHIEWIASRPMPLDPRYYLLLDEKAVHAVLDHEQPDVVEGSSPWTGGWMVARWPGQALKSFIFHQDPVAVYPQTLLGRRLGYERVDQIFGFYFGYLRALTKHYDLTITSGAWLADRLLQHGICGATAVPFGVDKATFLQAVPDPDWRVQLLSRCGASKNAKLLVTVSRHHPEKRLFTLLKAFELASRDTELALVVYGDGPLRTWVERKAKKIPGVWIAGYAEDRHTLAVSLASADALLHGSAAETFGIVIAEALCAGLPLVVPSRGGAPELADALYAELYEPGDAADCAAAIRRLLERDPVGLKSAARKAAHTRLCSVDEHFTALFATYETSLSAKNERRRVG